ncbi:PREDICTED: uncharacterized protein LOC100641558 isoform X2 [Amphimedon queenslandica]|uniref:Ig-like domain-containing protein n=1 Tax=Amphimedon queenslandica TaxID=400682 RepID=A0AAN0JBA3_AMPQE|nr:PREDICTED: uncharacterized protein LOC100641558 isoform X2 [Amphimedon queenslandica]|eukprot:XP_019854290.1 PREDICTED: uncharacterized protein LOC100641558 isoform X2 [Amphimedon queenslandica]
MPQVCKSEAKSTTVLCLLLLLPFILVTECCSGGYQFIGLSTKEIDHCDPFTTNGVRLLCEIKAIAATAGHVHDIQWYFNSVKLANGTSKYLIINTYHNRVFESVLHLSNLIEGTDIGTYMCQVIVEPNNMLLPQPSFSIPPVVDYQRSSTCGPKADKAQKRSSCASLNPSVSIQATSTTLSMSLQTTGTKSTDSQSSIITSTFIESVISASTTIGNTALPPIATNSVNNIASTTTSKTLTVSFSPTSNTAVNIASSASTTSSNSLTGNTVIHSSIVASNTLSSNGNTAMHSHTSSPIVSPSTVSFSTASLSTISVGNTDQYPVAVWMYIIVTILSTSILIFVLVTLVLVAMFCRRSPSSPTIDVVLRPRSRNPASDPLPPNPSDPLPPIRQSMILTSSETTKSSDLSFPLTTIHCSPLQNQLMSNQSLGGVAFNLQGPSHSSFTVYAEVESLKSNDVEETTTATTVSGFPNASGTSSSSHAYTLPNDTLGHSDDNTTSTGCWSPVVIREERQKQSDSTQNGPSSLLMCTQLQISSNSSDNISLSDEDRTSGSQDYYNGNLIVCHQSGPSSAQIRQTCSLTEQSFSLGGSATCHNRIVPAVVGELHVDVDYAHPSDFVLPANERIDEGRARKPTNSSTESLTTSLQILFSENERDGRDSATDDDNLRSSSSSSGCTDLSKYSGDYERDPNYMRALLVRRGVEEEVPHQRSALSPTQERQENLDSGMDGLFYLPSLPDDVEKQSLTYSSSSSDTYKSLESLTRNPSPVYMKPFLRETQENGFTSLTV